MPTRGERTSVGGLADAFAELEADVPGFEIFRRRALSADVPPTLRELGTELGISYEWVRQRERQEREAIAARLEDPAWPIRVAVDELRERLGSLARPRELAELLATLDPAGRVFGRVADREALLLHLAGYSAGNLWIQRVGLDAETDALLGALTERGPASLDEASRGLEDLGIKAALRRPWIEGRHGFRMLDELVARQSQTMETAAAVLRAVGKPLELAELFTATGVGMSEATFRAQIQHDDRFLRRGVRHYGLSVWGGERYTTIAEKMVEEIKRNGGALDLDALVDSLVKRFGVAEGSVRERARAPQFAIDASGRISCRVGALVVPPTPLALTHGCFHLEQGWALKLAVDPYLLRGSANRMPFAFARALGLRLGISQFFECPFGELHAYWPRYAISAAHLGSLRIAARELGATEGDLLFVVRRSRDRLDFHLVDKQRLEAASGMARLALECGFEPDRKPVHQVLAALGFDPGLPNAEAAISARLGERHERRLAMRVSADSGLVGRRHR